jgi:hypothetical protein
MTIDTQVGRLEKKYAVPYPKVFSAKCDYKSPEYQAALQNMTCTFKTELDRKGRGFMVVHR